MKRLSIIIGTLALALCLGGCALFPVRARTEELAVVQAMGVDGADGTVRLSLITAADSSRGEGPVRMSGTGATIPAAAEDVASRAAEETIFCAHTGAVLLGEDSAREDVGGVLRWVCRSREIRMDVPLLIVREGSAAEALLDTGGERVGAAELLAALSAAAETADGEALPSAGRIAGALAEGNCALAAALRCVPSSEREGAGADPPLILARAGWAVLKDGALAGFVEEEDAPALDLLRGAKGSHTLVVSDRQGQRVTLRTAPGRTEVRAAYDEGGAPEAIELSVRLTASVAAIDGAGDVSDGEYADELAAALERELLRRAGTVLRLSRELGADFLSLRERARLPQDAPKSLPVRLSVSVRVSHSNDVRDG